MQQVGFRSRVYRRNEPKVLIKCPTCLWSQAVPMKCSMLSTGREQCRGTVRRIHLHAGDSERSSVIARSTGNNLKSRWLNVARVSYPGVPGAFSSLAAQETIPNCEPVPCDSIEGVITSVAQWTSDMAIVPVQNTLEGTLHEIQDSLMKCDLNIVGEANLNIEHCLVALPGTKKENLDRVLSHPMALAQCSQYLRKLSAVREAVYDTAYAAKMVKDQSMKSTGAIASKEAASLYGLDILDTNMHDKERGDNITRYLILARDAAEFETEKTFKTSLVFTLDEGSGQLFKALSVFALRDINITKIESRPLRSNPILSIDEGTKRFNYIFYLDYIGHVSELQCKQAMRHLQELTPFLKVLGSYPTTLN